MKYWPAHPALLFFVYTPVFFVKAVNSGGGVVRYMVFALPKAYMMFS